MDSTQRLSRFEIEIYEKTLEFLFPFFKTHFFSNTMSITLIKFHKSLGLRVSL